MGQVTIVTSNRRKLSLERQVKGIFWDYRMTFSNKTSKQPPAKPKRLSSERPRRGRLFRGQERYSVWITDTNHDENIVRNYPASAFWQVAKKIMEMAESDRSMGKQKSAQFYSNS